MRHDECVCVYLLILLPSAPFSFDAVAPLDSQLLSWQQKHSTKQLRGPVTPDEF